MLRSVSKLMVFVVLIAMSVVTTQAIAQRNPKDASNKKIAAGSSSKDPGYSQYGIYAKTAPHAKTATARITRLPLQLEPGNRIAFVGNTLLEREQHFGHFESLIHQRFPKHNLVIRNLCWPADSVDVQPRPANFADLDQHLTHEKVDVVFAAFGFNESFGGEQQVDDFKKKLQTFVAGIKTKAFNGKTAPQIVLLSPIANEDIDGVDAGQRNNARLAIYRDAIASVAEQQQVGFVDVFADTQAAMQDPAVDLTLNGCHLLANGYDVFARSAYKGLFNADASAINETLRAEIVDKNTQYQRRYRPLNTFYYTGDRSKSYGYLDFLPAMRNFDMLAANRDARIWDLTAGKPVPKIADDSNVPPLPKSKESRGANRWVTAADELKAFKIDPRFDVTLFAGEEEFPDIAAPIQMRWDNQGRLWVSCSTTYPHVYPGNTPNDKLVILEDTDGDGKADKSSVFADDLNIPLSFEFGDGGVYITDMPHLTFLKDTNGDGKADFRRKLLTGFGTEDSHHSLHDFTWTPDGDLLFRESIFHHTQVETPYGPVRQQNSGWFKFEPATHRLTSFGTYHSTNPWGVTFDKWGQHVASHPVYAAAFHSLDPVYPQQHPKPAGLQAYSGTCGQEFVDFKTFPADMQGGYIKVRYKPTNRVEFHRWNETEFGFEEEYVSDIIFSTNLSFIPVDIGFGPRGAMYVCDWYNPVKGHAQYSLRDERRDRHSGRIWRITEKGKTLQDPPKIAGASIDDLLNLLKRQEYRYRYWAKRELKERDPDQVKQQLDRWVAALDSSAVEYRHHQVEALWMYRSINAVNVELLRDVLKCNNNLARAAAVEQVRHWHPEIDDVASVLNAAANDENGIVRMQAAIAASHVGSKQALDAILDVFKHPAGKHLQYAVTCALGSANLSRHWKGNPEYDIERRLKLAKRGVVLREPTPTASESQFDSQKNVKSIAISCEAERMMFTVKQFAVTTGQPIKLVFSNPDATNHNMVFVKPGALEEVGMAANNMARNPKFANSDFIPEEKRSLILHASPMIGPTRKKQVHVFRFKAPTKPGVYPYVCTFPGHWIVMKGEMAVGTDLKQAEELLAASQPKLVKKWTMADFADVDFSKDYDKANEQSVMRGMESFIKANCLQCHAVGGHGVNLGPDLVEAVKKFKGEKLLQQMLNPSAEINKKYQSTQFITNSGKTIVGVVAKQDKKEFHVRTNLLNPDQITVIRKRDVDEQIESKLSPMPVGLLNVLTREEILNLLAFLESGGFKLPSHLQHGHDHNHGATK